MNNWVEIMLCALKTVSDHHGVLRPQAIDGGVGLQILMVAADVVNK